MEVFEVLGYRNVDFTDERTGKRVSGITLFLSREDKNVQGVMTEKVFIGSQRLEESGYLPMVGGKVRITYNKYGKPAEVVAM